MTTKTIPAYLEDERQKDKDSQLRRKEETARIQPLNHGHHRTGKQAKLESPSSAKTVHKASTTAISPKEKPSAVRRTATKARRVA